MIIEPLPSGAAYWTAVRAKALELGTDGCSGPIVGWVSKKACLEHDVHYRTEHWIGGEPIKRAEADTVFRWRVQEDSRFDEMSPVSWGAWMFVRAFGWWPWLQHRRGK